MSLQGKNLTCSIRARPTTLSGAWCRQLRELNCSQTHGKRLVWKKEDSSWKKSQVISTAPGTRRTHPQWLCSTPRCGAGVGVSNWHKHCMILICSPMPVLAVGTYQVSTGRTSTCSAALSLPGIGKNLCLLLFLIFKHVWLDVITPHFTAEVIESGQGPS